MAVTIFCSVSFIPTYICHHSFLRGIVKGTQFSCYYGLELHWSSLLFYCLWKNKNHVLRLFAIIIIFHVVRFILLIWETEEYNGSQRRKLKIEKGGNDSLSIEQKEETQVIFHKSLNLLIIITTCRYSKSYLWTQQQKGQIWVLSSTAWANSHN